VQTSKPAVSAGAALAVSAASVPAALAGAAAPPAPHAAQAAVLDARVVHEVPPARPLVTRIVHESARKSYTVVSGDTLSGIAGRSCGDAGRWPGIYAQNREVIGSDPDLILPGQHFTFTCEELAAALAADSPAPPRGSYGHPYYCGDGDGDGWDMPCSGLHPAAARQQAPAPVAAVTGASGVVGSGSWPGGAFGACVVARESGGNPQVMNASGHYGLYQFSAATWAAYGGNPADFGNASVAEQERVFENALARGGQDNWSPYDGC
jgi:hypothetical protein